MGNLKKRIVAIVLTLPVAVFFFILGFSLIRCDMLTLLHGDLFRDRYRETMMLGDLENFRVLSYTEDSAEVYYVNCHPDRVNFPNNRCGNILRFVKRDGAWVLVSWGAVWASMGSADGFVWPYGRWLF